MLRDMTTKEMVDGVNIPKLSQLRFCEGCVEGKMNRKPFYPVKEIHSTRRLERIHMSVESISQQKYFVTFINDYSRTYTVYFLRQKSEVFDKFKEFEAMVTNDVGDKIGILRSDNGGEYISGEFDSYLKSKGIRHELTIPHTPQQNGVAERMNRTLMECARSMMTHAQLSNYYWAEAVFAAAYLKNRTPTKAFQELMSHLKVFGCVAYAHVPDSQRV